MPIDCGTQCMLCTLPIRIDTYIGCSHACKYCFVKKKTDITDIKKDNCIESLKRFISGKRIADTRWCDWDIPLHWGGVSDPFQPCEKKFRVSYNALKIFAASQYPFVVSTKGRLIADDEYLDLLSQCNCVVQMSAVCSKYDKMEKGAPTFEERLKIIRKVAPRVKRFIVRCQPYMLEVFEDVKENIPRLAEAGIHGIVFEGMKFLKKYPGTVKLGGDNVYEKAFLERDFSIFKEICHENGIKFYSGENRLRMMGDSVHCCGYDGLEGFKGNEYNALLLANGVKAEPTAAQKRKGTSSPFNSLEQTSASARNIEGLSFEDATKRVLKKQKQLIKDISGI